MKKISCELCGSNQLIKQDGFFVCEHCGTKYSAEEAKKLLIDGIVEVTGSVKIDSSDRLSNLYQIARRAKDEDNAESAERYYDMILIEDPESWEAAFYLTYFRASKSSIPNIYTAIESINNSLSNVFKLINSHINDEEEQEHALEEITNRIINIASDLFYTATKSYDNLSLEGQIKHAESFIDNTHACYSLQYNLGDLLEAFYAENDFIIELAVDAWKSAIQMHLKNIEFTKDRRITYIKPNTIHNEDFKIYVSNKKINREIIEKYKIKIKKYEPSYEGPAIPSEGYCYIATAVYGSYDSPEVIILRAYRDEVLSKKWYGRAFIRIYYAVSPSVVKHFGKTKWFNRIFKHLLDNQIENLKTNTYVNFEKQE